MQPPHRLRSRAGRRSALCLPLLLLLTLGCSLFTTPTPIVWVTPTPTLAAQAALTATPTATATPSTGTATAPASTPERMPERIRFAAGATQATVEGRVGADERLRFILGIQGGQFVEISATVGAVGSGLRFSFTGEDSTPIKPMGDPFMRTVVPSTQDYILELVSDVGAVDYTLSILIPVRVTLSPGDSSAEFEGSLPPYDNRHYAVRVPAGQTLKADATTSRGQVILIVWGADGTVLQTDHSGFPTFEGVVPSTQDYLISVRAVSETDTAYTLQIAVLPQ